MILSIIILFGSLWIIAYKIVMIYQKFAEFTSFIEGSNIMAYGRYGKSPERGYGKKLEYNKFRVKSLG